MRMKLPFGMNVMEIDMMENKDLVKVIEACGKNGVSTFKFGEIEINFNGFVNCTEKDYPSRIDGVSDNIIVDPKFEDQQNYEEHGDVIENLLLTDPVAYEEALFKDELEPSETHMDGE